MPKARKMPGPAGIRKTKHLFAPTHTYYIQDIFFYQIPAFQDPKFGKAAEGRGDLVPGGDEEMSISKIVPS
jgi:hypothetical protein